jgi:GTPase SAR1 family protein
MSTKSVRVSIVGASGVGKSTFSLHLRQGPHFDPSCEPPVTIRFELETVLSYDVVAAEQTVQLLLFDFQGAGPSADHLLHLNSVGRHADVVLFIYDVTRKDTFAAIRDVWAPHCEQVCADDPVLVLVGNKLDKIARGEAARAVAQAEAKALGDKIGAAHCYEISALGEGMAFKMPLDIALTEWLERPRSTPDKGNNGAVALGKQAEGKGCC